MQTRTCDKCGAAITAVDERCWKCLHVLAAPVATPTQSGPVPINPLAKLEPNPARFTIRTLFLWITLIAVCLGIGQSKPGLGIAVAVLFIPTAIRTLLIVRRHTALTGESLSVYQKVLAFCASLGVVIVVFVASGAAFVGTCWIAFGAVAMVRDGYDALGFYLAIGLTVAIFVGLFFVCWMNGRPRK